ncbi:MAG: hypothetical protein GXN93_02125 [Candidatus Diapherotrites archaeon]|nr:hypothetical protein [Candidatus Diapherotrites archaeon]
MSMEEFVLDNPWAADIPKSKILMALVQYLTEPRTVEDIHKQFPKLTEDDVAYALYVLKSLGVVDGDGEKVYLSELGAKFLKEYEETF